MSNLEQLPSGVIELQEEINQLKQTCEYLNKLCTVSREKILVLNKIIESNGIHIPADKDWREL